MRKLISLLAIVITAALISSCSSNSPKAVAEKAMKCIMDKDYKGYVNLVYFDESKEKPESIQRNKDATVAILGEKYDKLSEKKKGIKDYKVLSEEVKDSTAVVKMEISYGNGEKENNDVKMKMDKNGDWKIDNNK
jgi:hypothetical protein